MPNAATVGGRTGTTCPQSGPYRSTRGAKVVVFIRQGDRFPPDADGQPTTWEPVTAETL